MSCRNRVWSFLCLVPVQARLKELGAEREKLEVELKQQDDLEVGGSAESSLLYLASPVVALALAWWCRAI
jgi:hypothetical protein